MSREKAQHMVEQPETAKLRSEILGRLKVVLKSRGISLQEASENAQMGVQYVSKASRGALNPTLGNLIQICLANGIGLFEIILEEHEAETIRAMRSFGQALPDGAEQKEQIATELQQVWAKMIEKEDKDA